MEKQLFNIFDLIEELGNIAISKETKMAQTQTIPGSVTSSGSITSGSFIIGSVSPTVGVNFSRIPVAHFSAADARAECERLARMNPGKTFFFVEVKGGAYTPSPTLTKF